MRSFLYLYNIFLFMILYFSFTYRDYSFSKLRDIFTNISYWQLNKRCFQKIYDLFFLSYQYHHFSLSLSAQYSVHNIKSSSNNETEQAWLLWLIRQSLNTLPASRHFLTQSASYRRPPLLVKLYGTGPQGISLVILPDGRFAESGAQKGSSI